MAEVAAKPGANMQQLKDGAIDFVREAVGRIPQPPGLRVDVSGAPLLEREITALIAADQARLMPIALIVMIALLIVVFRSWHGVALCLASVLLALFWSLGTLALFGSHIDALASAIPITLLVYGAVDPIFVLSRFRGKIAAGLDKRSALVKTYEELFVPCFLTSVTTALAFFSFATMTLRTVVVFGVVTGMGVLYAFVATAVVLPLLLLTFPAPRTNRITGEVGSYPWLENAIGALGGWIAVHVRGVLVAAGVSMLLASALLGRLQVNANTYDLVPDGRIKTVARVVDDKLSGIGSFAILFEGPPGSIKRPETIAAIAALDAYNDTWPGVTASISLADLLREMNAAFAGVSPTSAEALPLDRSLVAQYLAVLSPSDRGAFVNESYSRAQLMLTTKGEGGSAGWRKQRRALEGQIATLLPPALGVTATVTGVDSAYLRAMDGVASEMVWGFAVGFAIVIVCVGWILRSVRAAYLSLLPNLLPAMFCFATFALLDIDLRLGTTLFLSVSIGGLFNTTIHLASRMLDQLRGGATDAAVIVDEAMRKVIPPAAFTALVLSLGFFVFAFSSYPDLRAFGILSMVSIIVGLLADTFVTPALFRLFLVNPALAQASPKEVKV
jgi:predicted RND superfamily exporter protein